MADIPGVDEPLLVHAYTHSTTMRPAPTLTAIAFINWWEGRGSKAHEFLQFALEADRIHRLARLSDQNDRRRNERRLEHG